MRFISNGFYFFIAIIAISWSFASTFEKDNSFKQKKEFFSSENSTSIKIIEISDGMSTPGSNKRNLLSLPKFTIQSESKIRRQGGSGTAFYIGQNTWVTARHVIDQCPKVFMSFDKKQTLIKDIFIHPNSDLAIFKNQEVSTLPFFEIKKYKNKTFSSGYPAGKPGDLVLNYLGHVALENKSYGVFEKGLVYSILDRSPFNLNSIGGLSGGPVFSTDNSLSGILVAENARRALAILVDNRSLIELLDETNMIRKKMSRISQFDLVTTKKNFANNGDSLRKQGVIRKIYCVF
ncbi:serine protease [Paracoccaceae bacterium]|nr:serine protease [Paracoccaceae bacterium]